MRMSLLLFAVLVCASVSAFAGRLDVAVIEFGQEKSTEGLAAAFANIDLAEATNSNRTMTKESYLQGGDVLFAQSFPAISTGHFATSTRLKDDRADVEGSFSGKSVSVSISLMAGVKAGLRNFQKRNYTGSGPLRPGVAQVISVRRIKGKSPSVIRGEATMKNYELTTVVVVQYVP